MGRTVKGVLIGLSLCCSILILFSFCGVFELIPKTWDMAAIKKFHLPPPDSTVRVAYAPEAYYDSLPEHIIYKTYPLYYREFEKTGYADSLRKLKPEIVFDPETLKTQEDWIKAGEVVFNWPVAYTPFNDKVSRVVAAGSSGKIPKDGAYLFNRYVIKEKGKLMVGSLSCASCHTQVLESGDVIPGAPGNVFNNTGFANAILSGAIPFPILQGGAAQLNFAPWAPADMPCKPATAKEFVDYVRSVPSGASDRQGAAYLYPIPIPSLIGVKDIKYFDRTGLMRNDGPGDLMRYAAFNQGMDMLTSYNGYIPGGKNKNTELPAAKEWNHPFGYAAAKYTDAQLHALTQYIYSLKPAKNPNRYPGQLVARGKQMFTQAGCVSCHTPPLYTNNKLTPANGFEPPKDHFVKYDIFNVSVETDSVSTLYSRRGTGYYKVPSLRGLWLQKAFFHNAHLTTLEEVFDPKRTEASFVPSGFKPSHLKTLAVKGHPFGLELNEEDKKALIAFLKTL
jgi:hypothetical protein